MTATHDSTGAAPRPGCRAAPRTVYELFRQVTTAHAGRVAFRVKRNGEWRDITWSAHRKAVERIAKSLLALGVEPGERVAILSNSRLKWVQCDSAVINAGAATVGIYASNLAPDCAFILGHSESGTVFVENDEQAQKVLSVRSDLPALRHLVVYDGPGDAAAGILSWEEFLARADAISDDRLEAAGARIGPEDLASLVYTSGTTGVPKGAMITHANLVFAADAASRSLRFQPHYHTLLFLPLAHVFARLIVYMCQGRGLCLAFAEDISKLPANLQEIRPHWIASVPRIYEKFYEKVATRADEAGGLKRRLFKWAVAVGRRTARRRLAHLSLPLPLRLQHAVADRLVLHRVRDLFGGRVVWAVSGAAPLNPRVNEFFHACGVPVLQGIGMTENSSLSNVNRVEHNKLTTVGPVVPGVEMKIGAEGEVLFRGKNVMKGYFKDREGTAEAIDADGWLHSGDVGEIDEDGFLTITDRKKDLIITAGGKNVAPQRVEKILGSSRYISHAVACGDRRKFISALITLDAENLQSWADANGLGGGSPEDLAREPRVEELIGREIEARNRYLASFESVKKFRILPHDLSIETGELTPTLKVRRKIVYEKHRELIESIYRE